MPELAVHEVGTAETHRPETGSKRRGHFLTDIAAQVWGEGYVGTVGTLDMSVAKAPASPWSALASDTTPIIWEATDAETYPQFAPTIAAEIGLRLWGGSVVFALPALEPVREADLVYWAADRATGRSTLWLFETKCTATQPAEHLPAWRRSLNAYVTEELAARHVRQEPPRDAHAELRLLSDWTRLPVEPLAELVGASRRTIYNWLAGKPIGEDAQARILRLRDLLTPVAESRDPSLVRSWLLHGDPSPATLAAQERWRELERLVAVEVKPLQPATEIGEASEGQPAYADSPDVLRAALLAFASPPARVRQPNGDWQPREATGIALEETEDAE